MDPIDTPLVLHDHSDIACLIVYSYKSEKLLSCITRVNKTVKLHFLSSAVLEIENVNEKASNF